MTILALTPDEFQTLGLQWVGAVAAVLTGAAVAAAVLLPRLVALSKDVQSLLRSRDVQRQDIQAVQQAVTQVALQTPAPVQQQPNPPATPPV